MCPSCLIFIQISYLNEIFKDKNISIYNVKEIFIFCETIFLMYSKYMYYHFNCVHFKQDINAIARLHAIMIYVSEKKVTLYM